MTTGVAYEVAQQRANAVQRVLDQLQVESEEGAFARDVQQLVAEMADFEDSMWRVIAPFRRGHQPETDPRDLAAAQAVAYLTNRVLDLFPRVRALVQESSSREKSVDGMERFDKAEAAITLIRNDFLAHWPMPDEARVKAAKEQAAAGKYHVL